MVISTGAVSETPRLPSPAERYTRNRLELKRYVMAMGICIVVDDKQKPRI
jgi:hypothetical protein